MLYVVAELSQRPNGSVPHSLASIQRKRLQEAAAAVGNVFDHRSLDVALEVEQVDLLPIAAVQSEHVPVFVDLGWVEWATEIHVRNGRSQRAPKD